MSTHLRELYKAKTYVELLSAHARSSIREKVGVTIVRDQADYNFTYAELFQAAKKTAVWLSQNTRPGDRILIAMPTSREFIEYFFGCLLSGRIAVPVPVEKATSRFSRLPSVIADCQPALALFRSPDDLEKMKASLGEVPAVVVSDLASSHSADSAGALPTITENTVAFIQYTSGSTANAKGVVLTHRNILSNLRMIQQGMRIGSDEKVLSWLPLHHDMGLVGMLLTFVAVGASTAIMPYQEFAREPISWLREMASRKATLSGAPTFAFSLIAKRAQRMEGGSELDLSSVRLMYCGSERISRESTEEFYRTLESTGLLASTFFPCYGMAEASLYVSGGFKNALELNHPDNHWQNYPSCGLVANGLSIRVVAEDGGVLPPGEVGEIEIFGPSVTHGYWQEIRAHMNDGVLAAAEDRWLKTGDLGCLIGSEVFITGRLKDLIKIRGRNIYPDDVEIPLETLSEYFSPNAVVAVSSQGQRAPEGVTIIAEINRDRRSADFSEVEGKIQEMLAEHDIRADRLVIVSPSTLPKTSSGKKQRQRTAALLVSGQLKILWDSVSEESSNAVPDLLAAISSYAGRLDMTAADEARVFPSDFVPTIHKLGFTGLLVPREFGGQGLNHAEFAEIGRGLGGIDLSVASMIGNHNTIGVLPILYASRLADKAQVLKEIAAGGAIAAFAMTEPVAGSNPRGIESKVTHGDGKMVLNGEKIWIGNAAAAEFITVFAKEFGPSGEEIGISAFLLRRSKHKFRVGPDQLTLGLKPMYQNQLFFEQLEVDEMDRLTAPGSGLPLAFLAMEYARFGLATVATGAMERVLRKTAEFALSRPIWTGLLSKNEYFKVRFQMASSKLKALDCFTAYTASQISPAAQVPQCLSLICKILAGEWSGEVADFGLQSMGGRGYTEDYGMARIWRDARVIRIFEGPTETVAFQLGSILLRQPEKFEQEVGHLKSPELMATIHDWAEQYSGLPTPALVVPLGIFAAQYTALMAYRRSLSAEDEMRQGVEHWLASVTRETEDKLALSLAFGGYSRKAPAPTSRPAAPVAPTAESGPRREHEKDSGTNVGEKLAAWLKTFTRTQNVDMNRSLAAYGVDSLLAYELMCFIEEEFGVVLPESAILEKPSLAEIQSKIAAAHNNNSQSKGQMA